MDKESEIKTEGDFLETQHLLGKVQPILSSSRIYKEIRNNKILLDGVQHLFTAEMDFTDVVGPGLAIKLLLDDLFTKI